MDPRIREVLQFVEEHYVDSLTLTQLARRIGLSQCRFEHLFKEHVGVSFKTYLREKRLLAAKGLLLDWSLSVKQVAGRVGYRSPSEFSRQFHKRYGVQPSQYRRGGQPISIREE